MTFTIAEDIKTLLANSFYFDASTSITNNPDFEGAPDFTGWVNDGCVIDVAVFQTGAQSCKFATFTNAVNTDTFAVSVNTISEASFYLRFPAASTSAQMEVFIEYLDGTDSTITYDFASADTWVKKDFTGLLTSWQVVKRLTWTLRTASEIVNIDNITFTFDNSFEDIEPNIKLVDDDPYEVGGVVTHTSNGEVIIGREQFLRIDQFNGSRSETFLVDMDITYEDSSASAPTNLKILLAELDRIFDNESLATTTYYYKPRYDWLGSYRLGVVKWQVEVLNALVQRPGI